MKLTIFYLKYTSSSTPFPTYEVGNGKNNTDVSLPKTITLIEWVKMNKLENLITWLKTKKITIAAAESCSGGYLSYLLTKTPGSSKIFKGSVVVYSLETKNKFFKIPLPLLKKSEGVSSKIAALLAKGTRKLFKVDIGLSLVGFAGPEAMKGIKKGTIFFAVADKNGGVVKKAIISGNRDYVRKKASQMVIDLLYRSLNSKR